MKSEDIELSSEECEEEPEAEPKGGETDPCLGFAFDFGPFFPFEESTPESGFFVVGSSLGGENLGLWWCWWVLPLRGLWGFVEGRVEKLRALASKGGVVVSGERFELAEARVEVGGKNRVGERGAIDGGELFEDACVLCLGDYLFNCGVFCV